METAIIKYNQPTSQPASQTAKRIPNIHLTMKIHTPQNTHKTPTNSSSR
jgi:hypothetical protein